MSEQTPPQASPEQPDGHQQIATSIEAAANTLPERALTIDRDFEGQVSINDAEAHVQLSKEDASPDVAFGSAEIGGSVRDARTLGAYGFRSKEGQGVEAATVRRMISPWHDGITRAGAPNHVTRNDGASMLYEHKFSPAARDKAGKLVTDMVISRAKRRGDDVERLRRAA